MANSSVDTALMIAVSAEIPDPVTAFRRVRRVLNTGSILSISEFLLDPDYPRRKTAARWAEKADLRRIASYRRFYSYTLNFQPNKRKVTSAKKHR